MFFILTSHDTVLKTKSDFSLRGLDYTSQWFTVACHSVISHWYQSAHCWRHSSIARSLVIAFSREFQLASGVQPGLKSWRTRGLVVRHLRYGYGRRPCMLWVLVQEWVTPASVRTEGSRITPENFRKYKCQVLHVSVFWAQKWLFQGCRIVSASNRDYM